MQNPTNIRRKAQKLAQKGATEEALAEYARLSEEGHLEPYDLVVYGDLLSRSGDRSESVKRYLEAMESYSKAGLNRNAIALGKKVRRLAPGATHVHKDLGELYAAEGLASESCLHYLEYLEHVDAREDGVAASVEEVCRKLLDLSLPSFQVVPRIVQAARTVGREKVLAEGVLHQVRRAAAMANTEAEASLRQILSALDPALASAPGGPRVESEAEAESPSPYEASDYTIDVGDLPGKAFSAPSPPEPIDHADPESPPMLSLDDFSFEEPDDAGNGAEQSGILEGLLEPEAPGDVPEPLDLDRESTDSAYFGEAPEALREQGIQCLERKDTMRAQRAFMKAASLFFEAARSRDAAELYERVVKIDPNHIDALRGLVEIAHINGEKAKTAHWGCELGDVLLAREMYPEAKVQFERVIAFDPQNSKAQSRLRRLNTIAGVKEAGFGELAPSAREVEGAQVVVRSDEPDSSQSSLNLSQILEEFRAAVVRHIPTEDSQSHYDLGMTYKEMGLIEEAIREFEVAAQSNENRPSSLEIMGECYLLLSRFEEAAEVLEHLVREAGGVAEAPVHLRLGRAYEALGDWDRAEEEYHRALDIDENLEEAVELLQSLEVRRTQGAA